MTDKVLQEAFFIPENEKVILGFKKDSLLDLFRTPSSLFRWFRINYLIPQNSEERGIVQKLTVLRDIPLLFSDEKNYEKLLSLFKKIFAPTFETLGLSIEINKEKDAFLLYSFKKKSYIDYLPRRNSLFLPIFYAENLSKNDFLKGLLVGIGVLQFFYPELRNDFIIPKEMKVKIDIPFSVEFSEPFVPFWTTYFKVLAFRNFTDTERRLWESIFNKIYPPEYLKTNITTVGYIMFESFYARDWIRKKIFEGRKYDAITIKEIKDVVKIVFLLEKLVDAKSDKLKKVIYEKINSYPDKLFFYSILKEFLWHKRRDLSPQELHSTALLFTGKENVRIDKNGLYLLYDREDWFFIIYNTNWYMQEKTIINTRPEKDVKKKRGSERKLII